VPLTVNTRHVRSVTVLHCSGTIVMGKDEDALDAALDHAEHESFRIVLNLRDVTRLDSIGVGLLVRHWTRVAKRGGAIHLAASPPFVTNVLDLTRLSAMMPNFASEDEAILSLLSRASTPRPRTENGPRLLIFDPSADLCTFVRTVLSERGFHVRTTCSFGDAKLLLRVDRADFILVGPCNIQLSAEIAARELAELAPRASILQLGADFKSHDALEATETLLRMFGRSDSSQAAN
jgi:anti-anti-sigma factor